MYNKWFKHYSFNANVCKIQRRIHFKRLKNNSTRICEQLTQNKILADLWSLQEIKTEDSESSLYLLQWGLLRFAQIVFAVIWS